MRITVVFFTLGFWGLAGCGGRDSATPEETRFTQARLKMVATQIAARGVKDEAVLEALRRVPRHLFVPEEYRSQAYEDHPIPIGEGQTISQPYIVGLMTELLHVRAGDKVLEVGTGSGYQAAVLAAMGCQVYTIEIRPSLASVAQERLRQLGYANVHVRVGDGYRGWPEAAPFAGIIVTAAPEKIPEPLLQQLAQGGCLVIPVGSFYQQLKVITKTDGSFSEKDVIPVRFVPMAGEAERRP